MAQIYANIFTLLYVVFNLSIHIYVMINQAEKQMLHDIVADYIKLHNQ